MLAEKAGYASAASAGNAWRAIAKKHNIKSSTTGNAATTPASSDKATASQVKTESGEVVKRGRAAVASGGKRKRSDDQDGDYIKAEGASGEGHVRKLRKSPKLTTTSNTPPTTPHESRASPATVTQPFTPPQQIGVGFTPANSRSVERGRRSARGIAPELLRSESRSTTTTEPSTLR